MKPDYDLYAILIFVLITMLILLKGSNDYKSGSNRHNDEIYKIENCKGGNNEKTN